MHAHTHRNTRSVAGGGDTLRHTRTSNAKQKHENTHTQNLLFVHGHRISQIHPLHTVHTHARTHARRKIKPNALTARWHDLYSVVSRLHCIALFPCLVETLLSLQPQKPTAPSYRCQTNACVCARVYGCVAECQNYPFGKAFFCLLCCCVRVLPDERACARAYSAKVGRGPELGGNQRPATHLRAPVRELAETSLEQEVEKHWEVLMLI